MTPAESCLAPQALGQQIQPADTLPSSAPTGWFSSRHTQSVPEELSSVNQGANDWMAARAATEQGVDVKDWKPRTPPQLIVSIIRHFRKLLPDPPQSSLSTGDNTVDKREASSVNLALSAQAKELRTSVENLSDASVQTHPSSYAREPDMHKYAHEGSALRPILCLGATGSAVSLRVCYAEYPSVLIVQSKDFQPHVQVRKSTQPAVHIYSRFPLYIDNQFDAVAKQYHFHPLDGLPGGPSRNAQNAEEEGLINPYIRQKKPTIFFYYDGPGASSGDGLPWQPRICIDTTSLW